MVKYLDQCLHQNIFLIVLLMSSILLSTAVRAAVIAKSVIVGILPSISLILVL